MSQRLSLHLSIPAKGAIVTTTTRCNSRCAANIKQSSLNVKYVEAVRYREKFGHDVRTDISKRSGLLTQRPGVSYPACGAFNAQTPTETLLLHLPEVGTLRHHLNLWGHTSQVRSALRGYLRGCKSIIQKHHLGCARKHQEMEWL